MVSEECLIFSGAFFHLLSTKKQHFGKFVLATDEALLELCHSVPNDQWDRFEAEEIEGRWSARIQKVIELGVRCRRAFMRSLHTEIPVQVHVVLVDAAKP